MVGFRIHDRMFRSAILLALTALVISACTATPEPDATQAEEAQPLTAVVTVLEGSVRVTDAAGTTIDPPTDGSEFVVREGDRVVASGDDALVELAWSDGAITRIGAATTFTIGGIDALDTARGVQDGGLSWNRESEASDAEPYGVRVDESFVTDRGEYFVVDCRSQSCRTVGVGGAGGDGSKTTYRDAETETAVTAGMPANWGELFSDTWVQRNAELDEDVGFAPAADAFMSADPSRAVLLGNYDTVQTVVDSACTGGACADYELPVPVGKVSQSVMTFGQDCSRGIPCLATVEATTTRVVDRVETRATYDLAFDGAGYSWRLFENTAVCIWTYPDGTKENVGAGDNVITWQATPTAAEIVDGQFVVTSLTGQGRSEVTISEPIDRGMYPGCEYWELQWHNETTMTLERQVNP